MSIWYTLSSSFYLPSPLLYDSINSHPYIFIECYDCSTYPVFFPLIFLLSHIALKKGLCIGYEQQPDTSFLAHYLHSLLNKKGDTQALRREEFLQFHHIVDLTRSATKDYTYKYLYSYQLVFVHL